jgi:hypothetical protein
LLAKPVHRAPRDAALIAIANSIELTGEEGVWRVLPYPLCWDVLAHRHWPPRHEIDGRYNCGAEEAGGI